MTYTDGELYDGEWREDLRSGRGICIYANKNIYHGNWLGNRHG